MPVTTIMTLPTEMCMEIVFQLPPRHVYKLMQTNQRFRKLCMSEKYWRRVALHLLWVRGLDRNASAGNPTHMVCMRKSYKATMDDFIAFYRVNIAKYIVYVNKDRAGTTETSLPLIDTGSASLEQLLTWIQKHLYTMEVPDLFVYGETAFQFNKRLVLDVRSIPRAIDMVQEAGGVPAATGFMTSSRYGNKLSREFLYVLDDDITMSLESKNRVRTAVNTLIYSFHNPFKWEPTPGGAPRQLEILCDELHWYDLDIAGGLPTSP